MSVEADAAHLLRCKLGAVRILSGIERAVHRQARAGASFSDETQDGGVVCERLTSPLLADLGEETVFDGIPFGGTGGIVADGDEQTEAVDEVFLQGVFPEISVRSIASAIIGQDEQAGRFVIAMATVAPPPTADRRGREGGRIARGAD